MADDDRLGQLQRSFEEVVAERDRLAEENRRLLAELKRLDRSGAEVLPALRQPIPLLLRAWFCKPA